MNLNLKLNKKQLIIIGCSLLVVILIIVGSVLLFARKSITGTEAAKILLTRENMNENDTSFSWDNIIEEAEKAQELLTANNLGVVYANTDSSLGTLMHDCEGGKVYLKDSYYNYQDISGASYSGLVVESRIINVEFEAQKGAEIINFLKNELNIVNKWVKKGYSSYLLTVEGNCETVYDVYSEEDADMYDLRILKRTTLENAKCVYEMIYTDLHSGMLDNPTYSLYIPGERYEYCYEHDGNSYDYLIAENENGYWNIFQPDENYFSNIIIDDDLAHYSSCSYESNSIPSNLIMNSSLREDIIGVGTNGLSFHVSAFDGFKNILIPSQQVTPELYDGGEKTYYNINDGCENNVIFELKNGKTLKINDTFTYNSQTIKLDSINFEFYTNPGFAFPKYDFYINFEMQSTSLENKFELLEKFLLEFGLTCKYDYEDIYKSIIKNSEVVNTVKECYTWRNITINSSENFLQARDSLHQTWQNLFDGYIEIKDNEVVTGYNRGKVKKSVDFAEIENFEIDSATYLNKQITINNAVLTINKSKVLEEDLKYVLKVGLARIDSNGNFISQNTVELKTLNNINSTTYVEKTLTTTASATYDIPLILSEGKYVIVVYVATYDEGIRVSKMHSIGFVDTLAETIETDYMSIEIKQNQDKSLNINYSTKLHYEIVLDNKNSYTYNDLKRAMMRTILSCGYPILDSKIQNENGDIIDETNSINLGTTYKLKFTAHTINGDVDAYVYCQVLSAD